MDCDRSPAEKTKHQIRFSGLRPVTKDELVSDILVVSEACLDLLCSGSWHGCMRIAVLLPTEKCRPEVHALHPT